MELIDFLRQTQAEVRERINNLDSISPYEELVFTEIVMQHMADIGMTLNPLHAIMRQDLEMQYSV